MEGVQRVQEVDEAACGRVRAGEARPRPLRAPRQGVPPRALQEGHRAAHAAQAPAGCSKDQFMNKVVFPVNSSPEFDKFHKLSDWVDLDLGCSSELP